MARRFGNTPFAELLAPNLARDDGLKAVADSLDKILAPAVPGIASLLVYARLAKAKPEELLPPLMRLANLGGGLAPLSEPLLDMLAWQFHVDGYEAAYDLEAKERMLLQSLMLHRRKGTPWAVRNSLMAAFGKDAGLDEWFNYAGKPYFFRVWLDVTGLFWDQEATPKALRLIHEYKNVRSWLEYLETRSRTPCSHFVGVGLVSHTSVRNRLYFPPVPAPVCRVGTGVGAKGQTSLKSILYFAPPPLRPLSPYRGCGLASLTASSLIFWNAPAQAPDFSRRTAFSLHTRTGSEYVYKEAKWRTNRNIM